MGQNSMNYLQRKAIIVPRTQHLAQVIPCSFIVHDNWVIPNPQLLGNDSVANRFLTVEMKKRIPYTKNNSCSCVQ